MGVDTKGYIFKKIPMKNIVEGIASVPNLKIKGNSLKSEEYNGYKTTSGFINIEYKGIPRSVFVFISESNDYADRLSRYKNFENVKGYIPSYGNTKLVINISLGLDNDALSVEIIGNILKVFGGVLMPNDCDNDSGIKYIIGKLDGNFTFESVRDLPNIVLNQFVSDYLSNSDISKVNNKLKNKIKGIDLLKEFAYRNLNTINN